MDSGQMDRPLNSEFIDRYLRNELNEAEIEAFELAVMNSPVLEQELEAALSIRQALKLSEEHGIARGEPRTPAQQQGPRWQAFALAASLAVTLFSGALYWQSSAQNAQLNDELATLRQAGNSVLLVSVRSMRSSGTLSSPDAVIQKPKTNSWVVFEVALSPQAAMLSDGRLRLMSLEGRELMAWNLEHAGHNVATVGSYADDLPLGRALLQVTEESGEVVDQHVLEFR